VVYDYVEKGDLSKGYQNPKRNWGYQNPKRNWGITMHFSQIVELRFGKKVPHILCILKLFWNYSCLITSGKCMVTHVFLFIDSKNPC